MATVPTDLVPQRDVNRQWVRALLSDWMANVAPTTIASYRRDLKAFSLFTASLTDCSLDIEGALAELLRGGESLAHRSVLAYKAHMRVQSVWRSQAAKARGDEPLRSGLAPRTINRRLAALRSLVHLARLGWKLDVPGIRVAAVRDTTGVSREEYKALIYALVDEIEQADPASPELLRGWRDLAILHLWHDLALRRAEVCGLDLSDFDFVHGTLIILGKGRTEPETVPVPGPTSVVLCSYIDVRGSHDGPLFFSASNRSRGRRLHGTSYNKILARVAQLADVQNANPHAFRHRAITRALNQTNGDIRKVALYSRHRDVRTVMQYDQDRGEVPRSISELVASDDD